MGTVSLALHQRMFQGREAEVLLIRLDRIRVNPRESAANYRLLERQPESCLAAAKHLPILQ